ncbi:glycosyltransferase [Pandoraea apista]|uniref:glycosyltransferase n=1 Tax=Pandoraea apista TaxID=93218 RepID=UPI000657CD53|nr:glycosyltransferase [Pandoraea apista]ALS66404.1 hypothetical protein AT395_16735 [Pandoraea apista]CFB61648.1 Rhamnosyltransferase WbbL [Pandoraea apista]
MSNLSFDAHSLAISIVSHGQGALVRPLLLDLRQVALAGAKILVTVNTPEDESFLQDLGYTPKIIRNPRPKGFGSNHNGAFSHADRPWFAVLNPDIRFDPAIFLPLMKAFDAPGVGVSVPKIVSPQGQHEDSVRRFPSTLRILKRVLARLLRRRLGPDYDVEVENSFTVDWAGGMFMLFSSSAYSSVNGFDGRYFMYLEDADICRRLGERGLSTVCVPTVSAIHDARRASSRNLKHLKWHLTSLARFLYQR